ncbi:MAG: hypothetical protein WCP17_01425 [bacterium]
MKKVYEDLKKVFDSSVSFKILCGIAIIIIALLIFYAGINVGFHKASFGRAWGDNYERNFGMMQGRGMLGKDNFPNASGAIGKIIKIELPNVIVQDKDNTEKIISINNDTKIQAGRNILTINDLRVNDFVVIIGSPNTQGIIEAKFIRVMPLGMPIPLEGQPTQ